LLGYGRADVARIFGVKPRAVTAAVDEIAQLVDWPTDE
jgi:hypothetical protein